MPADILPMSSGDDEQLRRIRVAAEDLADQPEPDRSFFLPRRAEEIGVTESVLKRPYTVCCKSGRSAS